MTSLVVTKISLYDVHFSNDIICLNQSQLICTIGIISIELYTINEYFMLNVSVDMKLVILVINVFQHLQLNDVHLQMFPIQEYLYLMNLYR